MKVAFFLVFLIATSFLVSCVGDSTREKRKIASADEQIQLLAHGDQSLAARLLAIRQAKKTIDLATYVFAPCDSSSKILLDAIAERAKSGVKVRFLLDANLNKANKGNLRSYFNAISPNIEFRLFNDAFILVFANNRSHVKILLVDGEGVEPIYFVGGRNNTDEYFGLSSQINYVDQDIQVRGPSAAKVVDSFVELWNSGSVVNSAGDLNAFSTSCLAKTSRDIEVAKYFDKNAKIIMDKIPNRSCSVSQYTTDRPDFFDVGPSGQMGPNGDFLGAFKYEAKRTTKLYQEFIMASEQELTIENQYYIPVYRVSKGLHDLRDRLNGTFPLKVYTNSTGDAVGPVNINMNCQIQRSAANDTQKNQKVFLVSDKGALQDRWELSYPHAPWRIHTKSAVRDQQDVFIGSYNMDPRSYSTNLESGAVIESCPALAKDILQEYSKLDGIIKADKNCAQCGAQSPLNILNPDGLCPGISGMFQ